MGNRITKMELVAYSMVIPSSVKCCIVRSSGDKVFLLEGSLLKTQDVPNGGKMSSSRETP